MIFLHLKIAPESLEREQRSDYHIMLIINLQSTDYLVHQTLIMKRLVVVHKVRFIEVISQYELRLGQRCFLLEYDD